MSTNSNVANLSITVVKTLVKMAGFGFAADMIDGAQECLNLLADIKNDALGNPNAEMIRSLNGAVKSELDAIQDALKHDGLGRKQVKQAAAQLAEAARETITALAEDDDALIRAVQQPQCFAEQLRGHAAPLPDYSSDEIQTHYETLLDRIAAEFLTLAPWSPNFNRVALTSLLRCFPALTHQIARLEHAMQLLGDKVDAESDRSREADADTHRKLDDLKDIVGSFSPAERKPLRVAFGSRPDVAADDLLCCALRARAVELADCRSNETTHGVGRHARLRENSACRHSRQAVRRCKLEPRRMDKRGITRYYPERPGRTRQAAKD